ncbi:hypothetical protein Ancab_001133 [Ancistrocladus abbreviatus]
MMSRQSQLPPRFPPPKKATACHSAESYSQNSPEGNDLSTRHQKSFSQSSVLEDRAAWLDDLLSDAGLNSNGKFHCRSASDSVTLLDGLVPHQILASGNDDESSASDESGSALESACVYGPNSPRGKSNFNFTDNAVLVALSDYINPSPMQYAQENAQSSGSTPFYLEGDHHCGASNELNTEQKAEKRHPRQRSRVRKLQYIAELERTVNVIQAFESEAACKISDLLQRRVALSMENSRLKQQMANLQQQKLTMDSEYRSLVKEAARLKLGLASSSIPKVQMHSGSSHIDGSEAIWQMLNWAKLNLD